MKKLLVIIPLLLFLGGCSTLPRQCIFPEPPEILMRAPADFVLIRDLPSYQQQETIDEDSGVLLSEVAGVVAQNYLICHETTTTLNSLQEWIRRQEELINK